MDFSSIGPIKYWEKEKFYVAIGIAWQRAIENDNANFDVINRSILIPAYRLGRHFVFKKIVISAETNLTGPYSYNNESSIELFTLPSIGTRFQLLRTQK